MMKNLFILGIFAVAVVAWGKYNFETRQVDDYTYVVDAAEVTASASEDFNWNWSGVLENGMSIEIKGINGDVQAESWGGSEVQVEAERTGRRSNPEQVRVMAVQHDDGITICAVYPSVGRRANVCAPGEGGHMSAHNNDTEVDFRVRVPNGIQFKGRTLNGDVIAEGLDAYTYANSVNGDVIISTSGLGEAQTVNGDLIARIGEVTDGLKFNTVNGDVIVSLPSSINASIRGSTVSGDIESDFPLNIRGQFGPRHFNGTLGTGGSEIKVESVNGEIRLQRTQR